jgi:hypothetical protein
VKGIQVCANKGPGPLQRGDNKKIYMKIRWGHLKIFFSRSTALANFNQTLHKSSLGEGDSILFK